MTTPRQQPSIFFCYREFLNGRKLNLKLTRSDSLTAIINEALIYFKSPFVDEGGKSKEPATMQTATQPLWP